MLVVLEPLVQVSWVEKSVSVRVSSGKSKDVYDWVLGEEGIENNVSFRSRTEKWEVPEGTVKRSV